MTPQDSAVDGRPVHFDFRLLVEESLAGIYVIQEDRFRYVNPTMARLFGYSAEELMEHKSVEQLVDPPDRPRVRENLRARLEGELDTLQYTFRGRRRDGSTFDAEVKGRRTEVEGVPAVIGTLLDVTERREERDRLRFLARASELLDSSLDYEATLESLARLMIPSFADLCVIDIKEEGTIRRLVAGLDGDEAQGFAMAPPREADTSGGLFTEETLATSRGLLVERVSGEERQAMLARIPPEVTEDRELPIVSLIVVPLIARGSNIGAILLATCKSGRTYAHNDFTFAREVARTAALAVDNARLFAEARAAIRRREEVLAVVSHDLRNPLSTILMSVGVALDQERRREGPLTRIERAAKQMERLIRDLLDLSAIDAGGLSVHLRPLTLQPVIARTVELLEETARSRSVCLEFSVSSGGITVQGDEDRLVQALSNLLANAIRFSPAGATVRIDARQAGDHVDIAVSDSGPGISSDQIGRVFDRFWRGRSGGKEGAGLGLAIVKGIAEAHGGAARAESCLGRGATFHLTLPIMA